jgi:hypothetical protein
LEPPEGFEQGKDMVWKLDRSLCALKQTPPAWYRELDSTLKELRLLGLTGQLLSAQERYAEGSSGMSKFGELRRFSAAINSNDLRIFAIARSRLAEVATR